MRLALKILILFVFVPFCAMNAHAQSVPSSADSSRVLSEQVPEFKEETAIPTPEGEAQYESAAPEGAAGVIFPLKFIEINGMSVFEAAEFESQYVPLYGSDVPLSILWDIANAITTKYRNEGYFLSRAYVPEQAVDDGHAEIKVIEGYIASVVIDGENPDPLALKITKDLGQKKPLLADELESVLLRLNDLYGLEYEAVLGKSEDGEDGTTELTLVPREELSRGFLGINNYGSRFTGPLRSNIALEHSFSPHHKTSVTGLASLPNGNELWLLGAGHKVQVSPSLELGLSVSRTNSAPGFTLKSNDIQSDSAQWSADVTWTPVRQRFKTLKLSLMLDGLNSNTDILGTALTRDKVRVARAGVIYDFQDRFLGANTIDLKLSKGLNILGSSDKNDINLSRQGATPDFTKLQASYGRQSYIADAVVLKTSMQAQWASKSLFSSEEFGFGGISMGRAYDFSEITGDHGISASAELQYVGIKPVHSLKVNPFVFYDIGKVWNEERASIKSVSAASAGFGARAFSEKGFTLDTTVAFPLTKSVDNPLYGNGKNPVYRMGLNYAFDFGGSRTSNTRQNGR